MKFKFDEYVTVVISGCVDELMGEIDALVVMDTEEYRAYSAILSNAIGAVMAKAGVRHD